jgi:hypothetical protein
VGDSIALRGGDRLAVGIDSLAGLAFRGGATARVCPESAVAVGAAMEASASPRRRSAVIELADGHVIFVPGSRSGAFADQAVFVRAAGSVDALRVGASGAHVALADGSVKFIANHVDTWTGACVGGTVVTLDPSPAPTPAIAGGAAPSAFPAPSTSASPAEPSAATTSPTPTGGPSSSPAPTHTSGPAPAPTPTPGPTAKPTPAPTPTPGPTAKPTPAPTPTPTPTLTPSFSIACAPTALKAEPGETARSTCTVTSVAGFESAVSLACTGLAGIGTCAFAGSPVTPPAGGSASSDLTVAVIRDARPGCYSFTVVATSGAQTERVRMRLDVPAGGKPSCA